ncbi:glycosyltransferase family 2 protein [Nocardioides jensenii]|uniref:glycosyltransferase family 2 protein n=1 Tax=Nocardioides jensenii TaxID=1843 RepID=UPI000B2AFA98|nr:glycosyltransferase family 2 protein [Nocardioides jensenii]
MVDPGRLRRVVRRRRAAGSPVLTVVIPVHNVEAYLPECLDSVLGQALDEIEVIAVDDGSTDGCPEILRERARKDPRLVVLTQPNAGQGPARNLAVTRARGEFLTFCDADDTVPPRAWAHMVEVLRETGSDFVVGAARRVANGENMGIAFRAAHEVTRLRTTIEESPVAMQDIIACNRVFRTRFWVDRVPPYRGHIAYEDHVPGLAAYVRAKRFDLITNVTYLWRVREDNTSTGQQKAKLENLLDRIAVKEEASDLLREEASPAVYAAWVARCLSVDFPPFITHGIDGSPMYRNVLSATYRTFLDRTDEATLQSVPQLNRLRARLCADGRWDELATIGERLETQGRLPRTQARDGEVYAVRDALGADLPDALWRMADSESGVIAGVRSVSAAEGRLRISGFAAIRTLDCSLEVPRIEAWLQEASGDATVPLSVSGFRDPAANVWTRHRNAGYDNAGFRAELDAADLTGRVAVDAIPWVLHVRVTQHGVVREGVVRAPVEGSAGNHLSTLAVGEVLVTPAFSGDLGFHLTAAAASDRPDSGTPGPAIVADAVIDAEIDAGTVWLTTDRPDHPRPGVLRGKAGEIEAATVEDDTEGRPRAGYRVADLADGDHRVVFQGAEAVAGPGLWEQLPVVSIDDAERVQVLVRRDGALVVRVTRP